MAIRSCTADEIDCESGPKVKKMPQLIIRVGGKLGQSLLSPILQS